MTKTTTKKLSAVEHAEQTLHELKAKHDAITAAGKADDAEMANVTFKGHTGDPQAAAKLETLTDRALRRELELKGISSAISTAERKLAEAKQAEAQVQARKVARELLKRAAAIVEHAGTLDDANEIRIVASRAIEDELTQMRSLAREAGLYVPSHEQFLSLGSRADQTAHQATPFAREFGEHIAPHERRNHMSYAQSWHDAIAKAVVALVGEDHKHKEGGEKAA